MFSTERQVSRKRPGRLTLDVSFSRYPRTGFTANTAQPGQKSLPLDVRILFETPMRAASCLLLAFFSLVLLAACRDKTGPTPIGPPARLTEVSGMDQRGLVATQLGSPLVVRVTDANGYPVAGTTVLWAVTESGGSIAPQSATTDAAGQVSGIWTLGTRAGSHTANASAAGMSVSFNATAAPGPVATMRVSSDSVALLEATTSQLSAIFSDQYGNLVTGVSLSWSSSDLAVATVNETGLLTGVAQGTATITVAGAGKEATVDVIVEKVQEVSISAGAHHTCGLTTSESAFCWGYNGSWQLGDGTTIHHATPVPVSGGFSFRAIGGGQHHTCGLTAVGTAYCWGNNAGGTLGDGSETAHSATPVAVSGGLRFNTISGGSTHTCGLIASGAAYCWGLNFYGQVGDGTTTMRTTPVGVSGGLRFKAISAGSDHTCGVTLNGEAYCWGENTAGQLGDGTTTRRTAPAAVVGGLSFQAISPGSVHTCGITSLGEAYCWGWNGQGQLGDGTATMRTTPVAVSGGLAFKGISSGNAHTCGIAFDQSAYCWGYNQDGQLGSGIETPTRSTPVAVSGGLTFR